MPKGNPYGGKYKPHKIRNPKVVVMFHESGKMKIINCIKFDAIRNDRLQTSDYVATAAEPMGWYTASIFPAKHWMTKEEWEKRKEASPKSLPVAPVPDVYIAENTPPAPDPPSPPSSAVPAPPSAGHVGPLTFTSIEEETKFVPEDEEGELTEADLATMSKPPPAAPTKVLSINDELPGEYNARIHLKEKFGLGKPEDLVTFDAHVAKNLIDQEASRKIKQMRNRSEMMNDLMREKSGFTSDGS